MIKDSNNKDDSRSYWNFIAKEFSTASIVFSLFSLVSFHTIVFCMRLGGSFVHLVDPTFVLGVTFSFAMPLLISIVFIRMVLSFQIIRDLPSVEPTSTNKAMAWIEGKKPILAKIFSLIVIWYVCARIFVFVVGGVATSYFTLGFIFLVSIAHEGPNSIKKFISSDTSDLRRQVALMYLISAFLSGATGFVRFDHHLFDNNIHVKSEELDGVYSYVGSTSKGIILSDGDYDKPKPKLFFVTYDSITLLRDE